MLSLLFGVAAAIVGALLLGKRLAARRPYQLSTTQIVDEIDRFLSGHGGPHDWDDFISTPIADPILDSVRRRCATCDWTTEVGRDQLRAEADNLRNLAS